MVKESYTVEYRVKRMGILFCLKWVIIVKLYVLVMFLRKGVELELIWKFIIFIIWREKIKILILVINEIREFLEKGKDYSWVLD